MSLDELSNKIKFSDMGIAVFIFILTIGLYYKNHDQWYQGLAQTSFGVIIGALQAHIGNKEDN